MEGWEKVKKEEWSFTFFIKGMKILWSLLNDQKREMAKVTILLSIIIVLSLLFPYILKLIFDEIVNIVQKKQNVEYIQFLVICMFLTGILTLFLRHIVKEFKFIKSLVKLENYWPVMAQEKLLALSLSYHERENTGKKISKINKGCEKLVDIMCHLFWNFLPHCLYFFVNSIFILVMDWKLGLIFVFPLIPAGILNLRSYKLFAEDWDKWEKEKEVSSGLFCQSLLNIQTVQNYVQEKREKQNLYSVRKRMEDLDIDVNVRLHKYFFFIGLLLHISFTVTIAAGIWFVFLGKSTPGTVVYIFATGNVTVQALSEMINVYMRIMRNLFAVYRMNELIEEKVDIKNRGHEIIPEKVCGNFEFKGVKFIFEGKDSPVLNNLNLNIFPNQMVALVSRSGEGKTTIARLLCRMYDTSDGEILLDGENVRNIDLYWYRRIFAVVHQDVDIFDSTICSNVSYPYPNASEKEVIEAIKAAHLEAVLKDKEKFPQGIYTEVGERGVRLSGGQRQRVGIARAYLALLNGAKVLILDEATSSLDSEAEKAIQEMIRELKKKMPISIVAIAHRLSTIIKADMIYVIGGGKVIEQGDHNKLMNKNGLYSKLVDLQKLGDLRK